MAPRSRSTDDDQAGQAARAEDSAAVSVIDEPTPLAPQASEAVEPQAPDATATVEPPAPQVAPDLPDPVGRPPLIEVSEAAARGAFPNLED